MRFTGFSVSVTHAAFILFCVGIQNKITAKFLQNNEGIPYCCLSPLICCLIFLGILSWSEGGTLKLDKTEGGGGGTAQNLVVCFLEGGWEK